MKTITISAHPNDPKINTLELMKAVVNNPPAGGFTLEDIESRLRIKKAVEAVAEGSTVIELEDADHANLKKLLPAMRWGLVDEFIPQFAAAVNNA